ncbi:replication initiation protein [Enterococcus faecium]|uniref:replication initiation protein n=1 Tax=Enterococcus faecium TaxID=1352 RepID=UPI000BF1DD09|nr:replication initiation protein [Enterococcus faecium]PEH49596.1 RepB family plasmid replication initiator protein [Enterococcus faecium]
MNEITKYHNSLNDVPFRKFTSVEMDLFFAICSKMREKGTDEVTLTFSQLRKLSGFSMTSDKAFITRISSVYNKLLTLVFQKETATGGITYFTLFDEFTIEPSRKIITIRIKEKFSYILNDLTGEFTRFELEEFTSLKSGYSKTLYRLLKQWRTRGRRQFTIQEFRTLLDVPKSYRMTNIDNAIIEPARKELEHYFEDLDIKKIKNGRGRGGTVTDIEFTFKKQLPPKKELPKVSLENWLSEGENS